MGFDLWKYKAVWLKSQQIIGTKKKPDISGVTFGIFVRAWSK